jgi:beta-1,4-N-acetylglucosaminyltransferase
MRQAHLILSHAGAGTVMEALRYHKPLVVVINTLLMDNHQTELARAMAQQRHLYVVEEPDDLLQVSVWNEFGTFVPVVHAGGDALDFPRLLDAHMGFINTTSAATSNSNDNNNKLD